MPGLNREAQRVLEERRFQGWYVCFQDMSMVIASWLREMNLRHVFSEGHVAYL